MLAHLILNQWARGTMSLLLGCVCFQWVEAEKEGPLPSDPVVIHHWLPWSVMYLLGVHTRYGWLQCFIIFPQFHGFAQPIIGVEASQVPVVKDPSATVGEPDAGSIPGWRSPGGRLTTSTHSILAWKIAWTESLKKSLWSREMSDTTEATEHTSAESIRILEELVHY